MENYLENVIVAFIFYYLRHRDCSRTLECSMTNVGCRKKRLGWFLWWFGLLCHNYHPCFQCKSRDILYLLLRIILMFKSYSVLHLVLKIVAVLQSWEDVSSGRTRIRIIFIVNNSHNVIWNLLVNLLQVFSNSFKCIDKAEINGLSDQTVERKMFKTWWV